MGIETIFQHDIFKSFILPFLLIFFIIFAILEKTKILGDEQKQINAIVAFVIGLIFIGTISPKLFVENMILFLTIAIIVMFIGLLLWGFVSGEAPNIQGKGLKWAAGIIIVIAVIIAVLWAAGVLDSVSSSLFKQSWSKSFWTNLAFVVVIAAAIAVAVGTSAKAVGK